MKHVHDTITKMRKTSGKLAKEALLQAAAKADKTGTLKEFLRLCYEPKINFYQRKVDAKLGTRGAKADMDGAFLKKIVATLHDRKLTGGNAKVWLADVSASFKNEWERELLAMLIDRDVKAGFSDGTINKVWPGMLTDIPYMRCLSGEWGLQCSDGIERTISDIVEESLAVSVASIDENGKSVFRKVIGHFRNRAPETEWYTISYIEDGVIKTSNPITKEHVMFLRDRREITVGELVPGDFLF